MKNPIPALENKINSLKHTAKKNTTITTLIIALGSGIGIGASGCDDRAMYQVIGVGAGALIDQDNPWRGALIGGVATGFIYDLRKRELRSVRRERRPYYEDREGTLYEKRRMDPATREVFPSYYKDNPRTGRELRDVYIPIR